MQSYGLEKIRRLCIKELRRSRDLRDDIEEFASENPDTLDAQKDYKKISKDIEILEEIMRILSERDQSDH